MKESADRKPVTRFTDALYNFLCMSSKHPQGVIIRFFLEQIVKHSDVCEQGSLLLYIASDEADQPGDLVLTDADRNANSMAAFLKEGTKFRIDSGVAGLAFCKRGAEYAPDTSVHPLYVPVAGQDIGALYCVPIVLEDRDTPFGVVSFHNTAGGGPIDEERRKQMDIAVKALEAMLALSPRRLVSRDRVFIVHGRDERLRQELEAILAEEDIEPVVIQSFARTGQDLLAFLERQIRDCVAGFVLLTPDDEGRLYQFGEPLRQRARQNVIFEGGYLTALFRHTQRVCFLQHGDLEIPSDLNGLLIERFTARIDPERIRVALGEWGMKRRDRRAPPAPDGTSR